MTFETNNSRTIGISGSTYCCMCMVLHFFLKNASIFKKNKFWQEFVSHSVKIFYKTIAPLVNGEKTRNF